MSLADFNWLADELRGELQQDLMGRGAPLSVEAQVAVGLYRLGHGASYVTIGHVFNVGKETADKASGRFVNAVLNILRKRAVGYVFSLFVLVCLKANNSLALLSSYPPLDRTDQWDEIKESFERRRGIPNVVGAIDGTHIPIVIPPNDEWKGYINRKSWASISIQCVVDGQGNFRNVESINPLIPFAYNS
jgi:hypothetical protein